MRVKHKAWKWFHGVPVTRGGPTSGHHGHTGGYGGPGKPGGSKPGGGHHVIGITPGMSPDEKLQRVGDYREGRKPGGAGITPEAEAGQRMANEFLNRGIEGPWSTASTTERGEVKDQICINLSEEDGLTYEQVNKAIGRWAGTSNDSEINSLSMQEACAQEFRTRMSTWQKKQLRAERREGYTPKLSRLQERKFLRTMYEHTQAELKAAGFKEGDTIRLYRGIPESMANWGNLKTAIDYKGNAMESWSTSFYTANAFGPVVSIDVPVGNILGTARTGFGCLTEGEFVIFGSVAGTQVITETVS